MRYSEIENILDEKVLETPYEDEISQSVSTVNSFVHTNVYYKIFYVFIIGSIFGCYMEQIRYYIQRGIWECRAGVIWGPFSEIYGVGAAVVFILFIKLRKRSPLTIFLVSVVGGAAFEYIASLFQQMVFHSVTWDYSKQPFNLGGRTSLRFAIYWGLLGLFFIKAVFPFLDRKLNQIRGRMAFAFTWVLIIFMVVNMAFSAIAVNRWGQRLEGVPPHGYMDEIMDNYYDNNEMKLLFPHMKFVEDTNRITCVS